MKRDPRTTQEAFREFVLLVDDTLIQPIWLRWRPHVQRAVEWLAARLERKP